MFVVLPIRLIVPPVLDSPVAVSVVDAPIPRELPTVRVPPLLSSVPPTVTVLPPTAPTCVDKKSSRVGQAAGQCQRGVRRRAVALQIDRPGVAQARRLRCACRGEADIADLEARAGAVGQRSAEDQRAAAGAESLLSVDADQTRVGQPTDRRRQAGAVL